MAQQLLLHSIQNGNIEEAALLLQRGHAKVDATAAPSLPSKFGALIGLKTVQNREEARAADYLDQSQAAYARLRAMNAVPARPLGLVARGPVIDRLQTIGRLPQAIKAYERLAAKGEAQLKDEQLVKLKRHSREDGAFWPTSSTPLHAACRAGNLNMVRLLLEHNADPNACEIVPVGGAAPLHLAVEHDFLSIVEMLLRAGASTLSQNARGLTPLHVAAQEGRAEITRLLLDHGADPNLRDFTGHNPAWWAKEFQHRDVLDIYTKIQVQPKNITARERLAHAGAALSLRKKAKKKEQGRRGGSSEAPKRGGQATARSQSARR